MSKMTFQEADRLVDELVHQQRFEEAVSQLEKMCVDFPEHIYDLTEYIAYVYLRMERPSEALEELVGALDREHFYQVEYFKDQLGHLPEFSFLSEKSLELKEKYQKKAKLHWELFPPSLAAKKPYPVLALLHGDGKNIEMIKTYWPPDAFVELGYLVVYIQSSQVSKFNGYSWTSDYSLSRDQVIQVFDKVGKNYDIDPNQIILGGFSGGSMIALDITLRQSIPVSQCIALCPADGPYLDERSEWNFNQKENRIAILYGEREFSEQDHPVLQKLDEHGIPYQAEICPDIGHWYPQDIVDRTLSILAGDSSH